MSTVEIGWRAQISGEVRPWTPDWSPAEDSGDVINAVTTTLTDLLTGAAYPAGLLGSPTYSGTTVTQTVQALQPGHNYRLVWLVNMGGSKVSGVALNLTCPF